MIMRVIARLLSPTHTTCAVRRTISLGTRTDRTSWHMASVLEVALDVEVDLLEVRHQLGVRLLPEAAVDGLVEPLDHAV